MIARHMLRENLIMSEAWTIIEIPYDLKTADRTLPSFSMSFVMNGDILSDTLAFDDPPLRRRTFTLKVSDSAQSMESGPGTWFLDISKALYNTFAKRSKSEYVPVGSDFPKSIGMDCSESSAK